MHLQKEISKKGLEKEGLKATEEKSRIRIKSWIRIFNPVYRYGFVSKCQGSGTLAFPDAIPAAVYFI
jgi:hypothetical protein